MSLLYHAYVYLEFLILACTIYILAPSKIMISGGCRAYLDAFSDYMNPLLGEMDKAEKMLSNLKK